MIGRKEKDVMGKKWIILIAFIACQLRWMPSDSPGIREYRVYWARNYVSDWVLIGITRPENLTYRLTKNGYYSVTAVNIHGSESEGCESVYWKKKPKECVKAPISPGHLKISWWPF